SRWLHPRSIAEDMEMETSADFATRFAPRTPAPLRWLNAVGRPARRLLHQDPEALLEEVERQLSEVSDGASVEWKDALRRYVVASAKTPAHLMGAFHLRNFVRRAVARRVQLERARPGLHPLERPPLVVCGLPRSGT